MINEEPILEIRDMSKVYGPGCPQCQNGNKLVKNYCPACGTVYATRNINLDLYKGEILGIVGESGSGKSTLMQAMYFDQEVTSGAYYLESFDGKKANLFEANPWTKKKIRDQDLSMVYQNPVMGLRMSFSAIANIGEKMISASNRNVQAMMDRGHDLLGQVDIEVARAKEAPRNFSGGMQQRVQIAKALSNSPPILLLDEVTTGLDLSVQADVLDLIKTIQRDLDISMVVVSHDLAVIRMLADRTIVMQAGRIIEEGLTDQILEDPQDTFTQKLVYSLI